MFIPRPTTAIYSSTGSDSDPVSLSTNQLHALARNQVQTYVIVIGPELQFFSDGTLIPVDTYVWISEVRCKLHVDKISARLSTLPDVQPPPEEGFERHFPSKYPHYSVMQLFA